MSLPRLSPAAQLRYMLQWFEEWSELQRQDFLPILAEKLARPTAYINGVLNSMASVNCHDKPLSLFQCRIKLFNEWYPTWSEEERARLVKGVSDTDLEFGAKLQAELDSAPSAINGNREHVEVNEVTEEADHDTTPALQDLEAQEQVENTPDIQQQEIPPESVQESTLPLEIAATS